MTHELKRIKEEFSERAREALKWVVTLGIFAFVIAGMGAWFAYENALPVELVSLRKEVAAKQSELDAIEAKLPEMRRKAAELEAKGVNFKPRNVFRRIRPSGSASRSSRTPPCTHSTGGGFIFRKCLRLI